MKATILFFILLITTCLANMPNNCKKLWDIKENKQTVMIYMCIEQPNIDQGLLAMISSTNTTNTTNVDSQGADVAMPTTTTTTTSMPTTTTTTSVPTTTTTKSVPTTTTTTTTVPTTTTTTSLPTTTTTTSVPTTTTTTTTSLPTTTTTTSMPTTTTTVPVITTTQKPATVPTTVPTPVITTTTKLRGSGSVNSKLDNNVVQNKDSSSEGLTQTTQTLIVVFSGIILISIIGAVTYSCKNKKEPITPNQSNQRMLDNRYSPGRGTNVNIKQQTNTLHPRRLQHMNSWYNSNNDIRKLSTQMKKKRRDKDKDKDKSKTHPGIPRAPNTNPPPLPKPSLHDREQDLRHFLNNDISLQNPRVKTEKKETNSPTDGKSSKSEQ